MSTWSQLEQLLTCAICLDRFRNPKLLPCQHTFCGEPCMEGLVDYARRQIKCPECRAEHRIPYNGVQSFPNNVTLTRFLDLHRGITGEEPEPLPSQMDRCGVCGEKSVCLRCSHCEKKVCDECRVAHLDILRREINRINIQVRRGLTKLTEHAQQASKNSEKLIVTSTQIRDEITESVRRLIKDLKDKEAKLLADLDEFTESETKNGEKLKDDLEMELQTLTSNCELVDEHVTEDDEWTDAELMEYKDIFTKTLDFLRNLDDDTINLSRKIKYIQKVDLENIRRTVADFGEVKITPATGTLSMASNANLSPSESSANLSIPQSTLMRSQSDHRLAAQFASRSQRADPLQRSYLDVSAQGRYGSGIGSDTERERGSSPPGRRGERFGSVRSYEDRNRSEFSYTRGWQRPGDTEYEPSNSSNFRSRFMRERIRERGGASGDDHSFEDPHDSDVGSGGPRVRFQEEDASSKKPKLFDNEEMTNMRAPLSGILKLVDSPQIMERLHQNGVKAKLKEAEEKANAAPTPTPYVPPSNPAPRPARQISEDEIEKQKKQNKMTAAQQSTPTASSPAATPVTPSQPLSPKVTPTKPSSLAVEQTASPRSTISPSPVVTNRRIVALQKEETRSNRSSSEDNTNSGAESADQDDDLSPTSAISSTTRRRIFASSHPASSGSASISNNDYGTESSRTTASKQPQPTTNSYYQSPYYGHTQRNSTSNSRYGIEDSSTGAAASTPTVPTYFSSVKSRRISRDEDASSIVADTPSANSTTSSYYSQYGRRSSVGRGSTLDDDVADSDNHADIAPRSVASSAYSSGRKPTNAQSSSERYSSSGSSYLRNRLAKSRSSHAIACEDSDDESSTTTNNNANPISPTTTSFRSRFGFGSNTTPDQAPAERPTPTRRTSRSGYQYRTRDQSPEDDSGAGSVTQYLIKKYGSHGSHTSANRPSMLSKSKSSHVIYGRSLSSSDEEVQAPIQASPYRRSSRDSETLTSPSYKSANSFGLTYPRQIYLQKRKMMMKIGSRGTNPSCFTWPRGVACAPDNSIVVADSSNHRVQVFDSTGRFQFEFGSYGSGEGEFDCLAGVTVNRIGHFVVSDRYNHRVQVFDASGRFLRAFGSEGRSDGKFSYPWGIATDALGFIYVCDKENHRIQVFQSDGTFVGKFGSIGSRSGMLEHPHYIAISNTNRIVVSDSNNHRVQVFDINGRSISTFGTEGSGEGQFKFPRGVAVDENGFIIVGDSGNNRIQIFNPDGSFLKSFGSWGSGESEFKGLEGVSISSTGNILVCDRENHRIQIF